MFRHLDVTSEAEWKAAVDATIAEFGKLDILVNDARLSGSAVEDLFDTAAWDQLARQGDDHGLAGGTAAIGCLHAVPLRQCAVLLERATAMSRSCWPNEGSTSPTRRCGDGC
jgi:NAD(P)-dependent dehydrogenase (short-subunit alcohol dehydrogenase family)